MEPHELTSPDRPASPARPASPSRARTSGLALACACLLYGLLAFGLNSARGATASGFGSFDDEPSHVVTGLMFRDYFAAGMPGSPRAFAEQYYVHYPKVGIGQWPPVFYVLQGLWMVTFGESTASLVALMSVLSALLAGAVFAWLRPSWPPVSAFVLGTLVCAAPLVQRMASVVMTEIPLALFCLASTLALGRFLAQGRARHALAFAAFAILAILTKGNGLALAVVPALAIPLSGRWDLLRRPALWIAGLSVALVCAPWYWLTLSISASTWGAGSTPTLTYASRAGSTYLVQTAALAGSAVTACALVGVLARPRGEERCHWAALVALVVAVILFHVVVPSSIEERHLTLLAAPWILLAGRGLAWLARRPWTLSLGLARVLPALLVGAFFVESFRVPPRDNHGYRHAVARIACDPDLADSHVLIASDSLGEGLFVAAGARARRGIRSPGSDGWPARAYLRATKVLGSSTWTGDDYVPAFADGAAMMAYLAELPVEVVAFDLSTRRHQWFEHMDTLAELLETRPDLWEPLAVFDVFRDGQHHPAALRLYRQRGCEGRPGRPLDFATLYKRTL